MQTSICMQLAALSQGQSCMQAKGSAKDLGQGLPNPSAAADKAKGLASDAKSTIKEEANVAGDVSELSNPFDGAGGLADQVHTYSCCSHLRSCEEF